MNHTSAAPTLIEFPLRLVSDLEDIRLAADVYIRRFDDESRTRLLGIENVAFDDNGKMKSFKSVSPESAAIWGANLDEYDELFSSNYVAIVASREDATHLNFALKLIGSSCSSLYIGYYRDTQYFLSPPCYYGDAPLSVRKADVKNLSRLLALKRGRKDDSKLELMADMFLYALSVAPRGESRFVELSIILEMLLLPVSSTELSYRFALRMGKFMAKHWAADAIEWFKIGQEIYRTRSRLVHSGRDRNLAKTEPKIEKSVRLLLTSYLASPDFFEEEALDSLCIGG